MISIRLIAGAIFFYIFITGQVFAKHHFAEVYNTNGVWKVDHFTIENGKLQNLVKSRSFEYETQARQFAGKIKKLNKNNILLSSLKLVSTEPKTKPLWIAVNEWNQDWEDKYAHWVEENLDRSFFVRNNLATDCADVAYAIRWIFARNNLLPVAATLAGTQVVVSHESAKMEWDNLPSHAEWNKDRRFLAGLNWVLQNVYTKTLYVDTYPVALTKEKIKPGLINLMGGHTEIFNKISFAPNEIPLEVVSSTLPRIVRELFGRPFLDASITAKEHGGLLNFRWPIKRSDTAWSMIKKENMPGFSMEQYQSNLCEDETNFSFCLFKKLGMSFNIEVIVDQLFRNIDEMVKQRIQIVKDGYLFCQQNDCSPGTDGWENWGTPSRDARLLSSIYDSLSMAMNLGVSEDFNQWLAKTKLPQMDLTYEKFVNRLNANLISSDPRDSIEARWALTLAAIRSTVYKNTLETQKLRTKLIEKASLCRLDPVSCQQSKTAFQELNSLSIDAKARNIILGWHNFCKNEDCPTDKSLDDLYQNIWFQSPLPWDSIEKRNGKLPSSHKAHLLNQNVLKVIQNKYLLLGGYEGNQLYEISTQKIIKGLPKRFGFEESLGLFYAIRPSSLSSHLKELVRYDLNFKISDTISFTAEAPNSSQHLFFELGHGKLLLVFQSKNYQDFRTKNEFRLIDLSKGTVELLGKFESIALETSQNQNHVLMYGDKNIILRVDAQNTSITEFPTFKNTNNKNLIVKDLLHLNGNEYLVNFLTWSTNVEMISKLIKYTPNSIQTLLKADNLELTKINSHFFYLQLTNEKKEYLFDKKMNVYFEGQKLILKRPQNDINFLLHSPFANEWQTILVNNNSMQDLPNITFNNSANIISASKEWISVLSGNESKIIDYQGNILEQSNFKAKSICGQGDFGICRGDNENILIEFFPKHIAETNMQFYQVGKANEHTLTEPLAYIINNLSGTGENISVGISYSINELNQGTEITLYPGVFLWYPKLEKNK